MTKDLSRKLTRDFDIRPDSSFREDPNEIAKLVVATNNFLYRTGEAMIMAQIPGSIAYKLNNFYPGGREKGWFYKTIFSMETAVTLGGALLGGIAGAMGFRMLTYGLLSKLNRDIIAENAESEDRSEVIRIRSTIAAEKKKLNSGEEK